MGGGEEQDREERSGQVRTGDEAIVVVRAEVSKLGVVLFPISLAS